MHSGALKEARPIQGALKQRSLKKFIEGTQRFVRFVKGSSICGCLLRMQRLELRSGGRARLDSPALLCIREQGVLLVELLLVVHA
jgi:hypothetical protein